MPGLRFAVLLMALLASACGRVTDSEQLRLCRAILPVLHAEGTEFREIRVAPAGSGQERRAHRLCGARAGRGAAQLWSDLRVRRHDVRARPARSCGGRDRRQADRARAAHLPAAFLAEAGPAETAPSPQRSPGLSAAAAYALQQLINALALAAVYACSRLRTR
jgi:hypothetical protein